MTNGWTDVANSDVILVMGGNPAENHPVGFRFVMEAKRKRKAKLVCIDPRFNRTAAVSDFFIKKPKKGKISSSKKITLQLKPSPKLIRNLRKCYTDAFLVGWKYEVSGKRKSAVDSA